MATARSKITGAKELERVLKRLGPRIAKKESVTAVKAGAVVMRRAIKAAAPVSGESAERRKKRGTSGKDYGPLKKNIRIKRIKGKPEYLVHTGGAFWGMFLEFGTKHMPPQAWFTPAFDATVAPALNGIKSKLAERLQVAAKEIAGPLSKIKKSTRRGIV